VQGGVRAMEVIVVEVERKEGSAMVAGRVGAGISPLSGDGLDKPFGLAVGLRAIRFGKEMFEAELLTGSGEEFGTVGGAAIGQHTLDLDAMSGIEVESLLERREDTGSFFIGEERGKGETAVIVDGDVEGLDARAWRTVSAVAGSPHTGLGEASELLDVEVEEIAWSIAFIAEDRWFRRFEGSQTVQAMTLQDSGKSGFGDGEDGENLGIGAALTTQSQNPGFEFRGRPTRLTPRSGGMIRKAGRKAVVASSRKPSADSLLADMEEGSGGTKRKAFRSKLSDHFNSHDRGKFGISVHVVRGECLRVECLSTTTLPNLFPADNLLKHDT
jgi:hypothetical protein